MRVCVLCHHDAPARDAIAGFVRQLGLQLTLPQDAPKPTDATYIERLQALRDAEFAVVLLPSNTLDTATATTKFLSRDLMLELGVLLGTLDASRVCFLLSGNPAKTLPWNGPVILNMDDAGLWHLLLARAMKQAGLNVDLNRAV